MPARTTTDGFDWKKAERAAPKERLKFLCDELNRRTRFDWVGIYWLESENHLVLRAWKGPQPTEHVRIPVGVGLCGRAARTGKTVNVPDVSKDPSYLSCFLSTRSELVVPIKSPRGKVLGEIDVDSNSLNAFAAPDVALVEEVARWIGANAA